MNILARLPTSGEHFTLEISRPLRIVSGASIFFPRRCPNGCSLFVVFTQCGRQASARACKTVWRTVMAKFLFIYHDYDAALAIARGCPPGHAIEIREMAGYA